MNLARPFFLTLLAACGANGWSNDPSITVGLSLEGEPTDVTADAGDVLVDSPPLDPAILSSDDPDLWVGPFLTGYGNTFAADTPILLRAPVGPKVNGCTLNPATFFSASSAPQAITAVTVEGGFATVYLPHPPSGAHTIQLLCAGDHFNEPSLIQIGGTRPQLSQVTYTPDRLLVGETYTFSATVTRGQSPIGHCWAVYRTPGLYSVEAPATYDVATGRASVVIANYPVLTSITFACIDHAQGLASITQTLPEPEVDEIFRPIDRTPPSLAWLPFFPAPFFNLTSTGDLYLYAPFTDDVTPNLCTVAVGPLAELSRYRFFTLPVGGPREEALGGAHAGFNAVLVQNEQLLQEKSRLPYGRWSAFFTCSDSVGNQGVYGPLQFDYNAP